MSLPDHATGKLPDLCVGGSAVTRLAGGAASTVLVQTAVSIAGFLSKTIVARFEIAAPVAAPPFRATVKTTLPSPSGGFRSGGRNPASGSPGGARVPASSVVNLQVR